MDINITKQVIENDSELGISMEVNMQVQVSDTEVLKEALKVVQKYKKGSTEEDLSKQVDDIFEEITKDWTEAEKREELDYEDPILFHENLAEQMLLEKIESVWNAMKNGKFTINQIEEKLCELDALT